MRGELESSYLGALSVQKLLEVLDAKVAHTNVLDLAGINQLLHLAPGIDKIPVVVDLLGVLPVKTGGPVHEVEVDVGGIEVLERGVNGLGDVLVPVVVQLGGEPDLLTGNARGLDALADFLLVAIGIRGVDVSVAGTQSSLDGLLDLTGLGLPGAETDSGHLGARVELVGLATVASCQLGRTSSWGLLALALCHHSIRYLRSRHDV